MNADLADFFRNTGADGQLGEPAKRNAGLADGYCRRCDRTVLPIGVCYEDGHPEAAAGGVAVVSEWNCPRCSRREGRWTGAILTEGSSEPLNGREDEAKIATQNYMEAAEI